MRFFGTAATYPHIDGAFREQVPAPVSNVYELPSGVGAAAGALLEPLAVAVHAVRRARPVDNANMLVIGGGTIGQLIAMVARAFGAGRVSVSDPVASRREFAEAYGAEETIDPRDDALLDAAREQPRGGWDVVLEASGSRAGVAGGLGVVRKGGRFVQVGTIAEPITLPANLIMVKELDVRGTFRYNHDFPAALSLLQRDRIPALDVVTATFDFPETPTAFAFAAAGEQLKVQVDLS
jgi:L-idonate 5-dehydrogenase